MFKLITLSAVLSAAALVAAGGPEVGAEYVKLLC